MFSIILKLLDLFWKNWRMDMIDVDKENQLFGLGCKHKIIFNLEYLFLLSL